MPKKNIAITLFLFFCLLPLYKISARDFNAGFVPGNIWYSQDPFAEGDKIRIYTAIFNPDTRELSGTVDFFDQSTLLGKKDFIIPGESTKDLYIVWTVAAGNHNIFGKIEKAKFLISDGKYEEVSLDNTKTENSTRIIEKKIIPESPNGTNIGSGIISTAIESVKNLSENAKNAASELPIIGNKIKNAIPESVSEPASTATNILEKWRGDINTTLQNNQQEVKNNISALNNPKASLKNETTTSSIQKPFEYVKLFFFYLLGLIFKYKIIFYGIPLIIIFLIARYIWHLIF